MSYSRMALMLTHGEPKLTVRCGSRRRFRHVFDRSRLHDRRQPVHRQGRERHGGWDGTTLVINRTSNLQGMSVKVAERWTLGRTRTRSPPIAGVRRRRRDGDRRLSTGGNPVSPVETNEGQGLQSCPGCPRNYQRLNYQWIQRPGTNYPVRTNQPGTIDQPPSPVSGQSRRVARTCPETAAERHEPAVKT